MVARLHPVAFWIIDHDAPPASMAAIPARRLESSGRPRYRPAALPLAIPSACRREHAPGEVVGWTRQHPTCRKIERDDADLLGVKIGAELLPIRRREAREAVDLLDQQHVARPGVGDEPEQFRPRQLRARTRSRHTFRRCSSPARRRTIRLRLGRGSHPVHRSKRGDKSERAFESPSVRLGWFL